MLDTFLGLRKHACRTSDGGPTLPRHFVELPSPVPLALPNDHFPHCTNYHCMTLRRIKIVCRLGMS